MIDDLKIPDWFLHPPANMEGERQDGDVTQRQADVEGEVEDSAESAILSAMLKLVSLSYETTEGSANVESEAEECDGKEKSLEGTGAESQEVSIQDSDETKERLQRLEKQLDSLTMRIFMELYTQVFGDVTLSDHIEYPQMIKACKKSGNYRLGVAVSMAWSMPLEDVKDMVAALDDQDYKDVVNRLAQRMDWKNVRQLIRLKPHISFGETLRCLNYDPFPYLEEHAKTTMDLLLADWTSAIPIRRLLISFIRDGKTELFTALISRHEYVRNDRFCDDESNLLTFIVTTSLSRLVESDLTLVRACDIVREAIDWGLSGQRLDVPTCVSYLNFLTSSSAQSEALKLFKLLYRSGCIVQAKRSDLSECHPPQSPGRPWVGPSYTGLTAGAYLHQAASHPRRLQDLCVFALSDYARWGSVRQDRIRRLGLPEFLQVEVSHQSVIFECFMDWDTPSHRDPPGLEI